MANNTCGGDPSLLQCGSEFLPSFCCQSDNTCTPLNTDYSAVLCVSALTGALNALGMDPVECDQASQNATMNSGNVLHMLEPEPPQTCGPGCCPPTYECDFTDTYGCTAISGRDTATATSTLQTATSPDVAIDTSTGILTSTGSHTSTSTGNDPTNSSTSNQTSSRATNTSHSEVNSPSKASHTSSMTPALIGTIVAVASLVCVGLVVWICLRRRTRRRRHPPDIKPATSGDRFEKPELDSNVKASRTYLELPGVRSPREADSNAKAFRTSLLELPGLRSPRELMAVWSTRRPRTLNAIPVEMDAGTSEVVTRRRQELEG